MRVQCLAGRGGRRLRRQRRLGGGRGGGPGRGRGRGAGRDAGSVSGGPGRQTAAPPVEAGGSPRAWTESGPGGEPSGSSAVQGPRSSERPEITRRPGVTAGGQGDAGERAAAPSESHKAEELAAARREWLKAGE